MYSSRWGWAGVRCADLDQRQRETLWRSGLRLLLLGEQSLKVMFLQTRQPISENLSCYHKWTSASVNHNVDNDDHYSQRQLPGVAEPRSQLTRPIISLFFALNMSIRHDIYMHQCIQMRMTSEQQWEINLKQNQKMWQSALHWYLMPPSFPVVLR